MKQFTITKKIAKHGSQSIIVIPRMLESELRPKTIVKVTIDIIREVDDSVLESSQSVSTLRSSKEVLPK
ncbi:hypothetical protein HYU06_04770 [Candidatus Woesearchaeota archaeon]|nr:hypothetical protein [Candidatus Woesearchaeota archaeon]